MKLRHEIKYQINMSDFYVLRQRLRAMLKPDPNTSGGTYQITSLYFDNVYDKALREKVDGTNYREKFRIRYYNDDLSFIRLEKKSKLNGLCNKVSEKVSAEEVNLLLEGQTVWMNDKTRPLVFELYQKMQDQGLRPKTIVEYDRMPFVYGPGNVRVTLDYNIRVGINARGFLDKEHITLPTDTGPALLEVKWDEFLPDVVKIAVDLNRKENAFSKYVACRVYG